MLHLIVSKSEMQPNDSSGKVSGYSLRCFHNMTGIRTVFGFMNCFFPCLIIGDSSVPRIHIYSEMRTHTHRKKPVLGEGFSIRLSLLSFSLLLIQFCKYRFIFSPFLISHMFLLKTFPIKGFSLVDLVENY